MPDEDETMGEAWRGYRQDQQARRAERLPVRTDEIFALRNEGYKVEQLTPYQFRINGVLDLYPIHNRWHHINTGQRGGTRNLVERVRTLLRPYYPQPT